MPSLASSSIDTNLASVPATATVIPSPAAATCEEHLSMEHLTRSEVFAKKPLQRVTSSGEEVAVLAECNNSGNVDLPFDLLPGEYPRWYSTLASGVLITLTNFRFFVLLHNGTRGFYNLAIQSIDTVECRELVFLHVTCKDGRMAKIAFENNESCLSWWRLLNSAIISPSKLDDVFAFAFYAWCKEEKAEQQLCLRSTDIYLPLDLPTKKSQIDEDKMFTDMEFSRLEFDPSIWRITELNKDYRFCPTYPKHWIVPASITDSEIESAGRYRSMRRVPAVVWRHRGNGAVLVRCSQPESGIFGWRSQADESLLSAVVTSCARQNIPDAATSLTSPAPAPVCNGGTTADHIPKAGSTNVKNMLILDARSYTAAWANRAKGGGFESTEYYQKCEIQFLGLANIHSIRYSFQKMRSLCWESTETNWFQSLDTCQWIYHLWALLASAVRVAEALHIDGRPVLVHCSDGWDRTTQIVSLAKLFLDPHYRTMKGFKELIEREWIAFGHKFAERSGTTAGDINQRAPVFLQWLDCVHYVLKENQCAFEFNEAYLVKLAQHVYSGLFGTFLCNSIAEYVNASVASRTFSIWSYLHPANRQFRNVFYVSGSARPILPSFQQRDLAEIWRTVYCPANDPANIRPRSFSTASMDGESAAAAIANKQPPAVSASNSEKNLPRAHSCDNLAPSSPPSISSDNLSLISEKNQGLLHRTGSDSSLTKIAGGSALNGLHGISSVEKDTEELLRSLVDTVEKSIQEPSDYAAGTIGREKRLSDLSFDIVRGRSADLVARNAHEQAGAQTTSDACQTGEDGQQQQDSIYSLLDAERLRSSTASTTTILDQAIRGTDMSTSTTDLNHLTGQGCRRVNGFLCDLNDNCPLTDGCAVRLMSGAVGLVSTDGGAINGSASAFLHRVLEPGAVSRTPVGKKGKPSPKDLIDTDGMTSVSDAPQQRVREIINNYERQLENMGAELEQLRSFIRIQQQQQNGHACFCVDRKKHLSADDCGDSLEPHSYGSRGNASDTSWEAVEEREAHPVLWVPDHATNRCMRCDSPFTLINRRHHCRNCGKLFCSACSSFESAVPDEQLFDLVRVCNWCFMSLRQQDSTSQTDRQTQAVSERERLSAQQQHVQHLPQARASQHQVLPQEKVSA